jgi:para-aminobenzoate synthetase component I
VTARLADGVGWPELLAATFPPGSVTGAPKHAALRIIGELEPVPRGPYCGAVGWVDADRSLGELAVGIRSFWWQDGEIRFGTGAGITWGSDPRGEWDETELKAERLLEVASRTERKPG